MLSTLQLVLFHTPNCYQSRNAMEACQLCCVQTLQQLSVSANTAIHTTSLKHFSMHFIQSLNPDSMLMHLLFTSKCNSVFLSGAKILCSHEPNVHHMVTDLRQCNAIQFYGLQELPFGMILSRWSQRRYLLTPCSTF